MALVYSRLATVQVFNSTSQKNNAMKRNQSTALARLLSSSLRLGLALGAVGVFASIGFASGAHKDTYYVSDHLASTVATADAAGEIAQIEADAFGTQTGPVAKDSRFTGKPYDADMGAYVFPFRNYRSDEARWMSADPSGFPDGSNQNVYCGNPLLNMDSLGLAIVHSTAYSALYYDNSVITSAQISGFEANLGGLIALNSSTLTAMVNQIKNNKNDLLLTASSGSASGGQSATPNSRGGWDGQININFGEALYSNVATLPANERPSSVLETLAHELSHAVLDAYDPNLSMFPIGYSGPLKTSVSYENMARTALNNAYRPAYHGLKLNSQGYPTE